MLTNRLTVSVNEAMHKVFNLVCGAEEAFTEARLSSSPDM